MKYTFMKDDEEAFSIERMSCVFKVSQSGFYRFVRSKGSTRMVKNTRLLEEIKVIHHASGQV